MKSIICVLLLLPMLAACGEVDPVKAKTDPDSSFFHCSPGNGSHGNCNEN